MRRSPLKCAAQIVCCEDDAQLSNQYFDTTVEPVSGQPLLSGQLSSPEIFVSEVL